MSHEEIKNEMRSNNDVQYFSHPLLKPNKMERRKYQEIIAASCCNKNSLVVLPTGLGKTPIAILVAAHRLHRFPESRVLVLAPTKPLVEQHRKTFEEFMNLPPDAFVVVTGKIKRDKRAELWRKGKVIFATPQVVENDIMTGLLNLHDFSLIVFDEAHRAVGDYAYTHIAKRYMEEGENSLILGLTASPGGTAEKIGAICGNLFIENVEIKTEHDWDVKPYVAKKEMEWVMVKLPDEFMKALKLLEEALSKQLETLRECGFMEVPASPRKISKKVLLELQNRIMKALDRREAKAYLFSAAQANAIALKILHAIELLQTQGVKPCYEFFRKLDEERESRADELLLADEKVRAAIAILAWMMERGIEHPKLRVLTKLLQKELTGKDKKAIVFTQYVKTAELIVEHLKKVGHLKPVLFVGQRKGFTQKKQLEVMEAFRKGLYNVLVASSVAEEGLDIPKVDVVVFYEPIPSEIRSIQRRGRTGRFGAGKIYILIGKGTMDEAFYWSAYHKERKMMRYLQKLRRELRGTSVKVRSVPPIFREASNNVEIASHHTPRGGEGGSTEENKGVAEVRKSSLPVQMSLDNFLKNLGVLGSNGRNKNTENKGERGESNEEENGNDGTGGEEDASISEKGNRKNSAPIIYVDSRERKLIRILQEFGADVRVKQVDVGDFQLSTRVGVERKTAKDFVNSIIDGRLFNQLKNLADAFEKPILIIEGKDYGLRNVHPNAIRGAIASAVLDFGITTLFTEDERETALLLIALARREQEGEKSAVGIRTKKQPRSLAELQEFVVAGLPGVNAKLARRLLSHFGSVRRVFMADEHELQKVEGIGKKKAREITGLLDAKYEGRDDDNES